MKRLKLLVAGFAFAASLAVVLGITSGTALAEERTWTGGGGNNNLATAENWAGDEAPGNGDSLVFPTSAIMGDCSADVTLSNNLDDDTITMAGISLTRDLANCNKNLTITGNPFKLSDDLEITGSNSGPLLDLNVDIIATTTIAFSNTSLGGLTFGANNVVNIGANNLSISATQVNVLLYAEIIGSGSLTFGSGAAQSSYYYLWGDSPDFTGSIVVNDGLLSIDSQNGLGGASSSTTIHSNAILSLNLPTGSILSEPLVFDGGQLNLNLHTPHGNYPYYDHASYSLSGSIEFAQSISVRLYYADVTLTGAVTGTDNISVEPGGIGSLTLPGGSVLHSPIKTTVVSDSNKSTYCDESIYGISVQVNNRYVWNVACDSKGSDEYPNKVYGILSGTGSWVNPISIMNGGVIAPGESPGILTVGNLLFEEGGTYDFEVGGAEPGQYDQIKVTGTVTLGNGTLNTTFWDGFRPKGGEQFIIIDNDGSDAVEGMFKDLPEGATFSIDGVVFRINYAGGDGNDVVLTVISVPAAPDTGVGLLRNNPLLTFATTSVLAGGIYLIARKQKLLLKK